MIGGDAEMELEKIVATNITELRKSKQWTQLELAEKLNYSDKSISKWERGDGMPDLKTLCKMAELFSVSIDFFVTEGAAEQMKKYNAPKEEKGYRLVISLLMIAGIWTAATAFFIYFMIYKNVNAWTFFIWPIPLSAALMYRFSMKWGNKWVGLVCSSLFCWSLLAAFYLQFLSYNFWLLFVVGAPIQAAIVLWWIVVVKYKK